MWHPPDGERRPAAGRFAGHGALAWDLLDGARNRARVEAATGTCGSLLRLAAQTRHTNSLRQNGARVAAEADWSYSGAMFE
ncbi:MAG: hypothetical protein ACREDD_06510, partial [Methylocella sp.]